MRKPTGKSSETLAGLMTEALKGLDVIDRKGRELTIVRVEGNCYYAQCADPTGRKVGLVLRHLRTADRLLAQV